MSSVRQTISENPSVLGSVYCTAYDAILPKVPSEAQSVVAKEFHALFTFILVLPVQLLYIWYIFSSSTSDGGGPFGGFIAVHLQIFLILFGGAVLRCLVGYYVTGEILSTGTYDYQSPDDEHRSQKRSDKGSHKSTRQSTQ